MCRKGRAGAEHEVLAETKSAAVATAAFDVPGCTAAAVARPLLRCRRVTIAVCDDFGIREYT